MAEIDPVILQLRADMLAYQNEMRTTATRVVSQLDAQERAIVHLENQMRSSSSAMANSLRGLAGAFGSYLSISQLSEMSDSFTRLQNNLRIAGLEGEEMKAVQDRLFASAQRYGVSIEELSKLYGNANQAASDLGVGQSQLLTLTNATAAALKITGTSTVQAQGAILGLTQALASGTVRAEEFNQINEGGLRPLLQLAANSEKYGGSIAKLRTALVDGKVSSQEFLQAILAGSNVLEGKAAQATLTLSAGYTTLNNALTVYFGEADKANGVSAAIGETFGLLADNLDTIIPALAAIGIGYGVYTVAANAATVATGAFNASLTLLARHPIILGLSVLAAGLAYLALKSNETTQATGAFAKVQGDAKAATDQAQKAIDKLATAHGKARLEAIAQAKAERDNVRAKLASAQASLILAEAEASRARSKARQELADAANASPGSSMMVGGGSVSLDRARRSSAQADANAKAAEESVISLQKSLTKINAQLVAPESAITGASDDGKKKKGASGPTAEEITARYSNDLRQIVARDLQARLALATNANDRAELESRMLNDEIRSATDDINATKEYSQARKNKLLAELKSYEASERLRIETERQEQNARDALDISTAQSQSDRDLLEAQSRLTDSRTDRRDIELRLLDLAYQQEQAELEAVVASKTATDAQKQIAEQRLRVLGQLKSMDQEGVNRDNESPIERARRQVRETSANMGDAIENIELDAIDRLGDGIANAATQYVKLGGIAGDVINGIIQDLIKLAARQALVGAITGGSGTLFGLKIPGFAKGTKSAPGGLAIVGENGPELVNLPRGSQVVPNNELMGAAARTMTGVAAVSPVAQQMNGVIRVALTMDNDVFTARVQEASVPVAIEVVKANAPGMVAAAKAETLRDLGRPRV